MVSGSDEHGTPAEVEAIKLGVSPKELTDRNHARILDLFEKWGLSFDNYTRTENPVHKRFVRDHLMKIYRNGYVFTQETEMLYCEDCKRFLPDRYVEGTCPYCGYEHARGDQCESCGRLLETTLLINPYCAICRGEPVSKKTTHWYFDLPKLSDRIAGFLEANTRIGVNARNFSLNLVREGLKPRAMTRDVAWGIPAPFPGASGKTVYVWVEAVLGYVSATIEYFLSKPEPDKWKEYWFNDEARTLYFIGKDNIPFHTIILPALLLAADEGYSLPWNVVATEFLQFRGLKASKSQKIGIWIDEALEFFPADYWRYFLMATRPEAKDSNFSWDAFTERVNADLNDTFGNFVHRTLTFIDDKFGGEIPFPENLGEEEKRILETLRQKVDEITTDLDAFRLQSAAGDIVGVARVGNQYLNDREPWNIIKKDRATAANVFYVAAQFVKATSIVSAPFIPFSAQEVWRALKLPGTVFEQKWTGSLEPFGRNHKIAKSTPLFRKIDADEDELEQKLKKLREEAAKKSS